jgi:hypothetical protein
MPLVAHPDWILLFGLIYAILAGPAYGGGDVVEGCEEFSFALPATRTERYLARLAVGGGALLLLTGINLLVLGLDLPQALSRLYYDAGLVKRQHPHNPASLYALVFAFPFTVFSGGFACAAVTRSRALVVTAWLWGGLASLSLLFLGGRYEELLWGHFRGTVTCPLLIIAGLVMLVGGWQGYRKKEVGPNAPRLQLPDRWWLWALAFLVGLALATALLTAVLKAWPGLQGLN